MEQRDKFERRLKLKAVATQKNYVSALNKFLRIQGITHKQLTALASTDLDEISLRVQEAMKSEQDGGKKATTSYMIYKAVKFYLRSQGINFELAREDKPRMLYDGSHRVTKDQIKELWDSFSANYKERNRSILLFLKDSGVRISDAAKITVEDYLSAREIKVEDERFKVFTPLVTQKTKDIAHIHIGPESIVAIDKYLNGRKAGPLFLSEKGGHLTTKAIAEIFHTTKVRRHLKGFDKISAHSMRKFHYSSLPFSESWIKWLEGKSTSVYLDNPEGVTSAYIKNYNTLRVFGGEGISADEVEKIIDESVTNVLDIVSKEHKQEMAEIKAAYTKLESKVNEQEKKDETEKKEREPWVI